jgi:hypothetical protein
MIAITATANFVFFLKRGLTAISPDPTLLIFSSVITSIGGRELFYGISREEFVF